MLQKIITYIDFDGAEKKQVCYFNMTRAEILKYNMSMPGGAMENIRRWVAEGNEAKVFEAFENLILASYGERTPDGRFIKNQTVRDAFLCTEAYSNLFMEIVNSEETMAAFIEGIMPPLTNEQKANVQKEMQAAVERGEIPEVPNMALFNSPSNTPVPPQTVPSAVVDPVPPMPTALPVTPATQFNGTV